MGGKPGGAGFGLHMVMCPHCKAHQIFTARVPKDVVVVMPCPACREWVVLFRDKVIAISRKIIERGSAEERKAHLADVIGEFLDAGVFAQEAEYFHEESRGGPDSAHSAHAAQPSSFFAAPITQEELERFVKIELRRLDNAEYFKKHFG
jgi:hypothetical protein